MAALTQSVEKQTCDKHGEFESSVLLLGDKRIAQPCPECSRIATEERRRQEDIRAKKAQATWNEEQVRERFKNACIPPRFQGRTFDNYKSDGIPARVKAEKIARSYAERFDERLAAGGGLVMCGKPGTGKTHLAAAIANYIIPLGHTAVFRTVLQAVRSVKETYSRDSPIKESEAIEGLTYPRLLILDEVGVQFGSDAERLILFEIINGRYEKVLPTILISNLTQSDLTAYLGERILDRMCEGGGVVMAFDWESYRRSA